MASAVSHFMHELSIAQSIFEIVLQHVPSERRDAVRNVHVAIGEMAGVVPESLEFCYTAIVAHTPLQDSKLATTFIPYRLMCTSCQERFRSSRGIVQCPRCEGYDTRVIGGTELNVLEIELEEDGERGIAA